VKTRRMESYDRLYAAFGGVNTESLNEAAQRLLEIGVGSTTLDYLYHAHPWLKEKMDAMEQELGELRLFKERVLSEV